MRGHSLVELTEHDNSSGAADIIVHSVRIYLLNADGLLGLSDQ